MKEHDQIKAFLAFIFIFSVMTLSQASFAALSMSPIVPGYSGGNFSSPVGSFSMTAANDGFIKPAVVNVGGKPITVPATLRMAANAGQLAKNAMKLNPWAIAGTLAAGWLLDEGLEYLDSQWQKQVPDYGDSFLCSATSIPGSWCTGYFADIEVFTDWAVTNPPWPGCVNTKNWNDAPGYHGWDCSSPAPIVSTPANQDDWDALPDPLPVVAPELPYAPYIEGAPVDAPEYDFVPFSAPLGDPYTKPDGSTAQPMAKVSPNGDSVTVDTYDQPLTDTNGDPVPNPQPQDTPEPAPNHCEENPNSIGCAQFGDIPAPDALPTAEIPASTSVVPIGGPGVCPASITTSKFGLTWSYQPICDFASAVRPFVLGFAWLGFAYIVAGTVRT